MFKWILEIFFCHWKKYRVRPILWIIPEGRLTAMGDIISFTRAFSSKSYCSVIAKGTSGTSWGFCIRNKLETLLIFPCVCTQLLSHFQHFVMPWAVAHQVPLSMGFPRQEYWSRLPFPSPGDLPDPGIKPNPCLLCLLHWQAGFLSLRHLGSPWYTHILT